jgi:hypothetical protein
MELAGFDAAKNCYRRLFWIPYTVSFQDNEGLAYS